MLFFAQSFKRLLVICVVYFSILQTYRTILQGTAIRSTHLIAATATGFHTDELQHWKRKGAANAEYSGQVVSSEPWSPPMWLRQTASPLCGLTEGKTHFFDSGV